MEVYHYHPHTKEFFGTSSADPNPLEKGEFIVPAHATEVAPPAAVEARVRCWFDGEWQQVEDHRGRTIYSAEDGTAVDIALPGPIPEGFTTVNPAGSEPEQPTVEEQRQNDILAQWPVAAQLEALTEAMETPPRLEKLEQLKTDILAIKTRYPKVTPQTNDVQKTNEEPVAAIATQTAVAEEQSRPQPAKRKNIPLRRRSVVRSRRSQLR